MDKAVSLTGMEYGGITPVGLPAGWPILVDENVADQQRVIVGSGVRGSKLLASAGVLAGCPPPKCSPSPKPPSSRSTPARPRCTDAGGTTAETGRHQRRRRRPCSQARVNDRNRRAGLVNARRTARQNVLHPMGFEAITDRDDESIGGLEDVQWRLIVLPDLRPTCSSVPFNGAQPPNRTAIGLVIRRLNFATARGTRIVLTSPVLRIELQGDRMRYGESRTEFGWILRPGGARLRCAFPMLSQGGAGKLLEHHAREGKQRAARPVVHHDLLGLTGAVEGHHDDDAGRSRRERQWCTAPGNHCHHRGRHS